MKFGLVAFAGLLALAQSETIGGQSGAYCDEWSKCGAGLQCVNKKCAIISCSESVACDAGFECMNSLCIPLEHVGDNGRYCDQWTSCPSGEKCFNSKCVPAVCYRDTNCATGFQCWNGNCVSTTQTEGNAGYCDQWTACAADKQCVNRVCVQLSCNISPDCNQGYVCHDNQYCIQVNNSHGVGRYCDANNECDTLHKC